MGVQKLKLSQLLNTKGDNDGAFFVQSVKTYITCCVILKEKELGLDHKRLQRLQFNFFIRNFVQPH